MALPPLLLNDELLAPRSDHLNRDRCRVLRVVAQTGTRACSGDGLEDLVWNAPFTMSPATVAFDDDNLTLRVQYDWSDTIVLPIVASPEALHVSQGAAMPSHHGDRGGFCVNVSWMPHSRPHPDGYPVTLSCCCASLWFFSGPDMWWFLQRVSFALDVCRETVLAKELHRKAFPVLQESLGEYLELSERRLVGSRLLTVCGLSSMPATSSDAGTCSPVLEELSSDSDVEETHPSGNGGLDGDGESGIVSCDLQLNDDDNERASELRHEDHSALAPDPTWRSPSLRTNLTTTYSSKGQPSQLNDPSSRVATVDAHAQPGGPRWDAASTRVNEPAVPLFLSSFRAPLASSVAACSPHLRFRDPWSTSETARLSLRRSVNTQQTALAYNSPSTGEQPNNDALMLPLVQLMRRRACRREPMLTCRWCKKESVDLAHERTCALREVVCDACGETFEANVITAHKQHRHSRRTHPSRSKTVAIARAEALLELLGTERDSSPLYEGTFCPPRLPSRRNMVEPLPLSTSAPGTATPSNSLTGVAPVTHATDAPTVLPRSNVGRNAALEVVVEPIDIVDVERLDSSSASSTASQGSRRVAASCGPLAQTTQNRTDESYAAKAVTASQSEDKSQSNRVTSPLPRAPKSRPLVSPPNTGDVHVQQGPGLQRLGSLRSPGALQPLLRDKRPSQGTDELLRRLHSSGIVVHGPIGGTGAHARPATAQPTRHPLGRDSSRSAQRGSPGRTGPTTTDDFDVLLTQQMSGLRRSQSTYSYEPVGRRDEPVCRHCGRRGGHGGQECPERRLRCKRCGGLTLYSEKERHRERCSAGLRRRQSVDDHRRRSAR